MIICGQADIAHNQREKNENGNNACCYQRACKNSQLAVFLGLKIKARQKIKEQAEKWKYQQTCLKIKVRHRHGIRSKQLMVDCCSAVVHKKRPHYQRRQYVEKYVCELYPSFVHFFRV